MKKGSIFIVTFLLALSTGAQNTTVKQINEMNPPKEALAPFIYLASDELMGRSPLRPEIHVAAKYISEQFKKAGIRTFSGSADYFQLLDLEVFSPAKNGELKINSTSYLIGRDIIQVKGKSDVSINAPIVFVGYGTEADFARTDVKGKIVLMNMGKSDSTPEAGRRNYGLREQKLKRAEAKGALAVIDRYKQGDNFWDDTRGYFANDRTRVDTSISIPVFLLNDERINIMSLVPAENASILITGNHMKRVPAKNVMGWIEGTDPELKKQFVVLSAHYDHLGVAQDIKPGDKSRDTIYNGARDNAIGVTAVINSARYFSKFRPKRSVLFIAYTAEELGLLGSKYFSDHTPVPLKQIVYNLNIDNASYNDTSIVTVVGLGRTSADSMIMNAAKSFGLTAKPDPAPKQNLFDRSDNLSLARKGIPAPTFSLGIKDFDEEIEKYYHEVSDQSDNFDLNYALKYIKSYILAAKYIADNPVQPVWISGDKYEAAWNELFGGVK